MELADIGQQKLSDGRRINLPPVVLAQLGSDPAKKTICMYGHLDVQPAAKVHHNTQESVVITDHMK